MTHFFGTLIWRAAALSALIFFVAISGVAKGDVYDDLERSATNNGYSELARATRTLKNYRSGLDACSINKGFVSTPKFAQFLDQFAMNVRYYIENTGIRRREREIAADYVNRATALVRVYLKTKAERFHGSAANLSARDRELSDLSTWVYYQAVSMVEVAPQNPVAMEKTLALTDFKKLSKDSRWGLIAQAIVSVKTDDQKPC